ncbi:MAG: Aconitate hydratase A [Alphaproteobacteria bacterium MarineAlpha5_Bin11]|nr:aconitate hydratase AcnA [Pelagibacteraceae bacterium]PPR44659.1 MAG: Aconitate hydratase A [Alphaproteobacteria bacterium MarineAlpha5_Bin11]PPR51209.1 MAG: Aconitate hydratase A [Alphaproteobacteria bacterium MarineAlpha5_Bin10]|tara:strand:+ start:7264 stop:9903 length:2640 start_codon:yes stop_codon:yes gene_type:complete
MKSIESFKSKKSFFLDKKKYFYFSLRELFKRFNHNQSDFPYCKKIILENMLRNQDSLVNNYSKIEHILNFKNSKKNIEIFYYPARILMQDFTGVPAVADLVAMREAVSKKNIDPNLINPKIPVDLIIDHSVMVDHFGNSKSFEANVKREFERNQERYNFLKWNQNSFKNFTVVPPGAGICHQVNLEYLSKTTWTKIVGKEELVYPDTLVGTDSHTTMVNALSILGWGVGGIEAEAAMLGLPITMKLPEVVGVKLIGRLKNGVTATDLVLTITEKLRKKNVVAKFVEYYGNGLDCITLADRATISNMAPEYGATCGFFPVDMETLRYLELTGKSKNQIQLIKKYSKLQGLWRNDKYLTKYDDTITIDLHKIEPCMAGPKRPQDKIFLNKVPDSFRNIKNIQNTNLSNKSLDHGSVVIAAITSCTNTSNPSVLVAAGLVAKKAVEYGLKTKAWVKTSLAPGSKVVTKYLEDSGLINSLNELGFNVVGYGCTTCIGNSGPLKEKVSKEIQSRQLTVCSVLSGNRNFEGRVHSEVKANYLASPPLVVIYALVGNVNVNITKDSLGKDKNGKDIFLKDLWPSDEEVRKIVKLNLNKKIFKDKYSTLYKGDKNWQKIKTNNDPIYKWNIASTYVKQPPFFQDNIVDADKDIIHARTLLMLGDSITTDHISPAGSIKSDSPAGNYLSDMQVPIKDFNSYGSRRGNHEVMMRGTFANVRLVNELAPKNNGGYTKCYLNGKILPIYEAAMHYVNNDVPLIVLAGKEYGTGSSRDWAAKGTKLLGIRAVIAESFERIHRSNLIGMGVIPFQFTAGQNRANLNLNGEEKFSIKKISQLEPNKTIKCQINIKDNSYEINLLCRIETEQEMKYYKAGGILNYVLNNILRTLA